MHTSGSGLCQDEVAARFPRPLIAPGLAPFTKPTQYPTAPVTEALDSMIDIEGEELRNVHNKKKRLEESVGRTGTRDWQAVVGIVSWKDAS